MDSIRLYLKYIGISFRGQLQYRASFIMMALGNFVITFIDFLGIWTLFTRFGSLKGWRVAEVALLYGMISTSFAISEAFARGFDNFSVWVNKGEFDRCLLRPRTTVLQVLGHDFQLMRAGRLLQALAVLAWASVSIGLKWTFPKLLLLVVSTFGGILLFTGLMVLQATMCFWSVQSLEFLNSFTYGGVETAQFPLSIYNKWFRNFFIFVVPLACVNYFPAIAILGKSDVLNSPVWLQWTSPAAGILFFIISLFVWRFGVRHYCSTGS